MSCPCVVWQDHPAVVFFNDCLSQCLQTLLGKKGCLFCGIQVGGGKGTGGRSCKQHSHSSLLPHPTLLAGREAEEKFPAVANAFTGYCSLDASCTDNCSPLDHNIGSQTLQLLSLDQI